MLEKNKWKNSGTNDGICEKCSLHWLKKIFKMLLRKQHLELWCAISIISEWPDVTAPPSDNLIMSNFVFIYSTLILSLYKNSNLSQLYFGLKVPVSIMFLLCSYKSMFAFFYFKFIYLKTRTLLPAFYCLSLEKTTTKPII